MAQAGTSAADVDDTQLALLIELIVDERRIVSDVLARFEAALAKSDKLKDDDATHAAKIARDKANVEEAHLNEARVRLSSARDSLANYSVAKLGSAPRTAVMLAVSKLDGE